MIEFRFEKIGSLFTRISTEKSYSWVQLLPLNVGAEDRGNCLSVKIGHMGYGEAPDVGNERFQTARADNFMSETLHWQCLFGQILVSILCEKISPLKHLLDSR